MRKICKLTILRLFSKCTSTYQKKKIIKKHAACSIYLFTDLHLLLFNVKRVLTSVMILSMTNVIMLEMIQTDLKLYSSMEIEIYWFLWLFIIESIFFLNSNMYRSLELIKIFFFKQPFARRIKVELRY